MTHLCDVYIHRDSKCTGHTERKHTQTDTERTNERTGRRREEARRELGRGGRIFAGTCTFRGNLNRMWIWWTRPLGTVAPHLDNKEKVIPQF